MEIKIDTEKLVSVRDGWQVVMAPYCDSNGVAIHTTFDINYMKTNENAIEPTYGSDGANAMDLYACMSEDEMIIPPGDTCFIGTGIAMEIPKNWAGLLMARSGLSTKKGLAPANKVGLIDSDYRGEIKVALRNHSKNPQKIQNGERIAQLLITLAPQATLNCVLDLNDTERGNGGFGSTGEK